jgi:hypothetical protein
LLDRVRNPADGSAQGEQGKRRVAGQSVSQGDCRQAEIQVRKIVQEVGSGPAESLDEPPCRVISALPGQVHEQRGPRISGRVERMTESGDALSAAQPVRHHGSRLFRRTCLREQRGDAIGFTSVPLPFQSRHRRRHYIIG